MDEEVKRQFDAFCASVGLNASVAVNLFVKAVLRERRIPFEISSDPFDTSRGRPKITVDRRKKPDPGPFGRSFFPVIFRACPA